MTDIIANILLREIGSTPKVQPVTPSTGLGAMTSRKGITAPQEEQQADPTQNIQRPIIDIYRKIVQQEIGDGSGLTGDKIPYDPLVDTPETLAARGYNPDEVLRNSVFSSTISGTKGRTPKDKVLTDIEDLIQSYEDKRLAKKRSVSKERATASSSILDVLEAELRRGMTSKQTDTQPTVSADSSRDRFELQGEMRDLPVLDGEGAPEVDTRSNELLDKELPSAGLGSRPALTDDDMGLPDEPVDKNSNFSVTVESLYSDFTEGGQEGTEAHIGQDSQNITLPAGIVADGLIYDGKTVTQGKNSILSKDFDPSKLDTTGAYKVVGNKKIKRSDYPSDVDFSKAVLSAFEDVAKTAAGSSWDSIKEGSKKAVVKVGWNKGPNWLKGDTAKSLYKELSKENPNASSLYSKILVGSTVKSGGASIGIAKARADSFNSIASLLGVNDITKVIADNTGKNTKFNYYDSKGNLLHTEQTSRSVDIYENGDREVVQKNSAGQW